MYDDDDDDDDNQIRNRPVEQCIVRQAWPLRPLETQGQPHKAQISSTFIKITKLLYSCVVLIINVNIKI